MKQDKAKYRNIEYVELCKTVRKIMCQEIWDYNAHLIEQALTENRGLKSAILKTGRKTSPGGCKKERQHLDK